MNLLYSETLKLDTRQNMSGLVSHVHVCQLTFTLSTKFVSCNIISRLLYMWPPRLLTDTKLGTRTILVMSQ